MKGYYLRTTVAACLIMSAMIAGTVSFGFFMEPVTSSLGFDRAQFSLYFSIFSIVGTITLPFYGKLIARFGTRPFVIICGLWTALSIAAFSLCSSLVAFYLVACLVGLGFFGCSYAVVPVIVSTWFAEKSGFVMGMASTVGGVFGILSSLVMPNIIQTLSWNTGYVCLGALIFILTVPPGLFLLRSTPQEVGLLPLGYDEATVAECEDPSSLPGMPYKDALRSPLLWIMILAFAIFAITSTITQHLPAHFVGIGFTPTDAGLFMGVMSAGVIITSFVAAMVVDKIGLTKSVVIASALYTVAFVVLSLINNAPLICVVLVFVSICNVNMTIFAPLVTSTVFGPRDYAAIWGLGCMANVLGQAVGAPLFGLSFDITGSYAPGMIIAAAGVVVACLLCLCILTSKKKHQQS